MGLTKDELIAYTSLYIYFTECSRNKLYVPPFLSTEYKVQKDIIEQLKTKQGKPWWKELFTESISKEKIKNKNFLVDVRALYLFQKIAEKNLHVASDNYVTYNQLLEEIKHDYFKSKIVDTDPDQTNIEKVLISKYLNYIDEVSDRLQKNNTLKDSIIIQFMTPLRDALTSDTLSLKTHIEEVKEIKDTITLLFTQWIQNFNSSSWISYHFLLAGNICPSVQNLSQSNAVFMVQDQIRISLYKPWNISLFSGGLVDPLIRGTALNKSDEVRLPIGISCSFDKDWSFSLGVGIPMEDLTKNVGIVATLGYEISLSDIVW